MKFDDAGGICKRQTQLNCRQMSILHLKPFQIVKSFILQKKKKLAMIMIKIIVTFKKRFFENEYYDKNEINECVIVGKL